MTSRNARRKPDDAPDRGVTPARRNLLDWYDANRRILPWRSAPGRAPDPYHVWLSEIMLQQTTVPAVKSYFEKFLRLWPDVHALADAAREDVMREWAGLGYYARARNLHDCARIVARERGGRFPDTQVELVKLPGIGDYTGAAIAAIAFGRPAVVVDGNVERVVARFFNVREPLPGVKKSLKAMAARFFDGFADRPGDLAQAFMDLGSSVCTPKSPKCFLCPLRADCAGFAAGDPGALPARLRGARKPYRYGYVYLAERDDGAVLIHRRPESGLLGGMVGLPTTEWVGAPQDIKCTFGMQQADNGHISHVFTHFSLTLYLRRVFMPDGWDADGYEWVRPETLGAQGFPSLFAKAARAFQKNVLK